MGQYPAGNADSGAPRESVEERLTLAGRQGLLDALHAGKLDFYVALEGSGEIWKLDPVKYYHGIQNPSRIPNAAIKVFP